MSRTTTPLPGHDVMLRWQAQPMGNVHCLHLREADRTSVVNWPGSADSGDDALQRLVPFDIDSTLICIGLGNLPQRRTMNPA